MEEISTAYAEVGLTGGAETFAGVAKTYSFVAANKEVGQESIEEALKQGRTYKQVVEALARDLKRSGAGEKAE